ncbi:uracil-DNA glycosylase [Gallibacterium salpingitidis]|uniref:Type-4 uracil-DNA glycosylase n=1 Tax=Gallibacterium salpingitidis TaxID=505341 RepID=A0A1A7NP03_9PAST|nr:uracil-DNA glycosylase [Gallibacterium salpingitidis]OBW91251.1 uracil-DNA glycosylase [Gallibacterium salpingitidis]WKT00301.1 uracil-DNA glycosylase [Gallibacterium salpingitidis]
MVSRREVIEQLFAQLQQQFLQPLVPGWGNQCAEIMFIGDAPGKDELEKGPFAGTSGKFFDQMLTSIGLVRENIYLTNVVKFRPEKRDPNKHEIATFSELLQAEIALIAPKIIVPFGRIALSVFLPELKISEVHGQVFSLTREQCSFLLLPMYHPAAAMHNGKIRPILKQDFLILGDVWNELD